MEGVLSADFVANFMTDIPDVLKDAFWQGLGLPNDGPVTVRHVVAIPFAVAEAALRDASIVNPNFQDGTAGPARVPISPFMLGQLVDPIRAAVTALDQANAPPAAPFQACLPPGAPSQPPRGRGYP